MLLASAACLPQVAPSHPESYDPPAPIPGLTVDTSMLLDREFILSGTELERAVSCGDSSRLRRQVARLMEGAQLLGWQSEMPCAAAPPVRLDSCQSARAARQEAPVHPVVHVQLPCPLACLPTSRTFAQASQAWPCPLMHPSPWSRTLVSPTGEHVRITAVGASITSGAGGREWERTRTNWPGYVVQFADWLRAAFPRANATVHNAGMAGTFSGVFAQCFDTLIPPADVYILEQTTFDGTEPERCYCKDHYVNTPVQVLRPRRAMNAGVRANLPAAPAGLSQPGCWGRHLGAPLM